MNRQEILASYKQKFNKIGVFKDGSPKKALLKYNLELLKSQDTNVYIDSNKYFNPITQRLVKIQYDTRYKIPIVKKSFLKGKELRQSVLIPKDENKIEEVFKRGEGGDNWSKNLELTNNNLLNELIKKHNISGDWRIVILVKEADRYFDENIGGDQIDIKKGEKVIDKSYFIDKDFWKNNKTDFQVDSSFMVWNYEIEEGTKYVEEAKFIFTKEKKLNYKYHEQKFLDGVNHCFFTPIVDYFKERVEESKSKDTVKKYTSKINVIMGKELKEINKLTKKPKFKNGMIQDYLYGIPEKDIGFVCEKLQIGVIIEQPFCKTHLYEYRSNKKPLKIFRFINSRFNHLECNYLPIQADSIFKSFEPISKSKKELEEIKEKLIKEKTLCVFTNNAFGVSSIRTLSNYYKLESEFSEAVTEFETKYGLNYCDIDSLKYPELMKFINFSTHYNTCIDLKDTSSFNNNENIPEDMGHIDMSKAYTQFKKCKNYCGFMGKITDFRKVENHDNNGIYFISNLNLDDCSDKFIKINNSLKWFHNNNSYTKAELDMLKSKGGKFTVEFGAFSCLEMDFDFTPEMINGKDSVMVGETELKIPFYSKWTGAISMDCKTKVLNMSGTKAFFENLCLENDTQVFYNKELEEAKITYHKKYSYNKKHITAQITAYMRLIMLEQLENMNIDKIYRICVDGIYYQQHNFKTINSFSDKSEKMTFRNSPTDNYLSNLNLNYDDEFKDVEMENIRGGLGDNRKCVLREAFIGAGGNGKSFYNLNDKGLINPIFIGHSWKLTTNQQKEYMDKYNKYLYGSVHYRLFNNEIDLDLNKRYNNYIIDEVSMLTEEQKKFIFQNVCGKVILLGDLGYQLPPIDCDKEMTLEGFDNVVKLEKNYRFKCDRLKRRIDFVRGIIEKNEKINYKKCGFNCIKVSEVKDLYNKDDLILVSRHEYNDEYNKLLNVNKYKVCENTRDYKNGEIIFEDIENVKTELRNGYTIHSIQGETHKKKLFIHMKKISSIRMFYTAISRAEYLSQIYLVF